MDKNRGRDLQPPGGDNSNVTLSPVSKFSKVSLLLSEWIPALGTMAVIDVLLVVFGAYQCSRISWRRSEPQNQAAPAVRPKPVKPPRAVTDENPTVEPEQRTEKKDQVKVG